MQEIIVAFCGVAGVAAAALIRRARNSPERSKRRLLERGIDLLERDPAYEAERDILLPAYKERLKSLGRPAAGSGVGDAPAGVAESRPDIRREAAAGSDVGDAPAASPTPEQSSVLDVRASVAADPTPVRQEPPAADTPGVEWVQVGPSDASDARAAPDASGKEASEVGKPAQEKIAAPKPKPDSPARVPGAKPGAKLPEPAPKPKPDSPARVPDAPAKAPDVKPVPEKIAAPKPKPDSPARVPDAPAKAPGVKPVPEKITAPKDKPDSPARVPGVKPVPEKITAPKDKPDSPARVPGAKPGAKLPEPAPKPKPDSPAKTPDAPAKAPGAGPRASTKPPRTSPGAPQPGSGAGPIVPVGSSPADRPRKGAAKPPVKPAAPRQPGPGRKGAAEEDLDDEYGDDIEKIKADIIKTLNRLQRAVDE